MRTLVADTRLQAAGFRLASWEADKAPNCSLLRKLTWSGLKPAICWLFNVAMTCGVKGNRNGVRSGGVMLARKPVGWVNW